MGEAAGEGYSVNVPWPCGGMRNADYLAAFNHVVLPIAYGECRAAACGCFRCANGGRMQCSLGGRRRASAVQDSR